MKKQKQPTQRAYQSLQRSLERATQEVSIWHRKWLEQRCAAQRVIAEHIASERELNRRLDEAKDKITSDSFKITELENQVAMQHKMLAEAQSDGALAISRYNRAIGFVHELQDSVRHAHAVALTASAERDAAKRRITYRVYDAWLAYTRNVRWWFLHRIKSIKGEA